MVEVVNDTHVFGLVLLMQICANGHEVGGFTAPAAVVVEAEFAAELFGALDQGQQRLGGGRDARLLSFRLWTGEREPNLRVEIVFFKQGKGFIVHAPESEEFQTMFLILQNLFFKLQLQKMQILLLDFQEENKIRN